MGVACVVMKALWECVHAHEAKASGGVENVGVWGLYFVQRENERRHSGLWTAETLHGKPSLASGTHRASGRRRHG